MKRRPWVEALRRCYFEIDPRSLGLGRIVIGALLLGDLFRRMPWVRDLYSNDGLLPNHTMLWRPPMERYFSVFLAASLRDEAALLFGVCFVCFFLFMVGFHTRLFHCISFVLITSLHNRVLFVENGGAVAMGCLLLWTLFMPLGRRFSVDAVRAGLRARRRETPADLRVDVVSPDTSPFVSLSVFALLLQLAVIYYFNFAHKTGVTWQDGSAVHYVLWQERIVTMAGVWVREHVPFSVLRVLTKGTLVIEASAPFLLLTPFGWRYTRPIAIVALSSLHLGIALVVNLGIFSAAMLAYYPFLLAREHWDALERLFGRRGGLRTVIYDAGSGLCFQLMRLVHRLDGRGRLTFVPADDPSPPSEAAAVSSKTDLVLVDPANGRQHVGPAALAELLRSLPWGRLWAWPLRVPPLRPLVGWLYTTAAPRREAISGFLGVSPPAREAAPVASSAAPAPLRRWLRSRQPIVRELLTALTFWVILQEVLVANPVIPAAYRMSRPYWMVAAVMYPHLFEGWSMFSPDAPLTDSMVYVDAVTRDGRHVDPFNEVGSRVHDLPLTDLPTRLGHDSFFCDYSLRISGSGVYHPAFTEWILGYPRRTGKQGDEIVSFEAHLIERSSPAPGAAGPGGARDRIFLRHPAGVSP